MELNATRLRKYSAASRKGWRSRKKMAAANVLNTTVNHASSAKAGDGIALMSVEHPRTKAKPRVGYAAILAASRPELSSAVVARELGISAAYVRKVWSRHGLPKRASGYWPAVTAKDLV